MKDTYASGAVPYPLANSRIEFRIASEGSSGLQPSIPNGKDSPFPANRANFHDVLDHPAAPSASVA